MGAEEVTIAVCVPDRVRSGEIHAADRRCAARVDSFCARVRAPGAMYVWSVVHHQVNYS